MIRAATPADIARITDVYNEVINEGGYTGDLAPLSVEERTAWFGEHTAPHAIFVKEADGNAVGYATLSPYRKGRQAFAGTCEISYYLASAHRGRGIGKELIRHALAHAAQAGFSLVVAILLASNARSISLLEQFGFQERGRLPGAARIGGAQIDHLYLCRTMSCQK